MKSMIAGCALVLSVAGISLLPSQQAGAADGDLLQQMDISLFSIGGRATWYDPQDGQSRWFGGGQVRFIWLEDVQSRDQNIKNKSFDENGHMITAGLNSTSSLLRGGDKEAGSA